MEKNNIATSSKRDQIVIAARKLFLKNGYKATSMDAIVKEAAISKPTLYNHFHNKEQLFAQIACGMCDEYCASHCSSEDLDEQEMTPELILKKIGQIFLNQMILNPEGRAMLRMAISESPQFPELGQSIWDTGLNRLNLSLSSHLDQFNQKKILHVPDPDSAAKQFLGLVSGPYLLPVMLGTQAPPKSEDVDAIIEQAITVFMAGYQD